MSPLRQRITSLAKGILAIFMAALMVFTPLNPLQFVPQIAPVQQAQAGIASDLGDCVGGMLEGTIAFGQAQAKALELATVMTDPTYLACMGKAAGGDVVTIAMMVGMTALWGTGVIDFDSPEGCKTELQNTIVGILAGALDAVISQTGSDGSQNLTFVGEVLKALVGDTGINLIKEVAHNATKDLVDQLWDAMSPITSYLDCGCAAAGTIAKAVSLSKEIVGLLGESLDGAKKCLALFSDIGELAEAAFNGAKEVLTEISSVVCDATKAVGGIDACGLMEDAWNEGKKILGTVLGWAEDGLDALVCLFSDCDPPPPPPDPPQCSTDPQKPDGASVACICPAGMGFNIITKTIDGVDTGTVLFGEFAHKKYYVDYKYCSVCANSYAITTANGMCQSCPPGILPGPDNKCSVPVSCGPNEALDQSGHACFSCPSGMHFSANRRQCEVDPVICVPGSGKVPTPTPYMTQAQTDQLKAKFGSKYYSYMGKGSECMCPTGQVDNGKGVCTKPISCKEGWQPNYETGQCEASCPAGQYWGQQGEIPSCVSCPAGQTSYNNVCVPKCPSDTIRIGFSGNSMASQYSCMACPAGTQVGGPLNAQGERTSCINSCPPGTNFQTFSLPEMQGLKQTGKMIDSAACFACPAGTYSKTETIKGLMGSFANFDVTTCEACPRFTESEAGSASCNPPRATGIVTLPANTPPASTLKPRGIPVEPDQPKKQLTPPKSEPTRREEPSRRDTSRPSPTSCPAGRVWDGRRCVIDLGDGEIDLGPRGSGSGAPGGSRRGSGSSAAPDGRSGSSGSTVAPSGGAAAPSGSGGVVAPSRGRARE